MNSFIALFRVGLLCLCTTSIARASDPAAVAKAVAPGLVKVEFHLQYDKGEAPQARGWAERCPNCGQFHVNNSSDVVEQERPMEAAGFVLSPTQVLTADPLLHPRFLKEIRIVDGEGTIPAKISAVARKQNAIVLELSRPLEHARPLEFDGEAEPPYMAVTYSNTNGEWMINVQPAKPGVTISDRRQFITLPSKCLITNEAGTPVAVSMNEAVPAEGGWKGSPLEWEVISVEQQEQRLAALRSTTENGLLRTTLHLRSPRGNDSDRMYGIFRPDAEESPTIRHANAVLVDAVRLLVLADLEPTETARLESIDVHLPGGETATASFKHSLRDYGALVAELEEPLHGPLQFSTDDIRDHRDELLWAADVALQGENRVAYYDHRRIASFDTGWRRHIYPQVPGDTENLFLFDYDMKLLALPFKRRPLPTTEETWTSEAPSILAAATDLTLVLADVEAHSDPGNVPLSEQEEARLAWLGVELQELTPELARINNVAHLTADGSTGALVTYVYPDSPAAKAGIEVGHVLLRLHVEDRPQPIDVTVESYMFAEQPFPWDQLDQAPEQVFEQIPQPWPPAETTLTRTLTDLGFGKKFVLETAAGGQVVRNELVVEQSPDHFDSADRIEVKPLGLTVRHMTYEVRRYFHREAEEPGVVISKIEVGSHASKAGLKPYEFITHVNDQPVPDMATFEELTRGGGDLRLQVRRMTKGRIVKLTIPATEPATQPVGEESAGD
jgi:hypothetical protein